MERSRATPPLLFALITVALLLSGGATRAQAPLSPLDRYRERLSAVDSLASASRADSALVLLQNTIREARRRGDRRALAVMVQTQGVLLARQGRDAQAQARESLQLAVAARDTTTLMGALSLMGTRPLDHDGLVEPAVEWLLRLALDRDDHRYESMARTTLGEALLDQGDGEAARKNFTRAIELSRLASDWRSEMDALSGMGRAHFMAGELDQARDAYRRVSRIAEDRKAYEVLASALTALAEIEVIAGDLDAAADEYRKAWGVYRRSGNTRDWFGPALQTANVQRHLEAYADAETTLIHVMAECDSLRQPDSRATALAQLARTSAEHGKPGLAAKLCREGMLTKNLGAPTRAGLVLHLARALAAQDSTALALTTLDRETRTLRGRLPSSLAFELESTRFDLLQAAGRQREALDVGRRALNLAPRVGWQQVALRAGLANAERAGGRPDRAAVRLQEAVRAWAEDGVFPSDLDARERREAAERRLRCAMVENALASMPETLRAGRVRAVYDTLQRFRERGQIERTLGPPRGGEIPSLLRSSFVTVDSLQHSLLGESDLVLDFALGTPSSFLFAITRDSLRVVRLPDGHTLERQATTFCSLFGQDTVAADPAALDSSAARLGVALLGGAADLVKDHGRLVIAADGDLPAVPFAALTATDPQGVNAPLLLEHYIDLVPTPAWLASRTSPRERARPRTLALAGPAGADGAPIPGVAGEVEGLRARYQGVDVAVPDRLGVTTMAPERLREYDLMHLAALARTDERHPWYSGVLVEPPTESDHDPYIRGATIAVLRLNARLVVLSRCEPARGRVNGDGLIGLATAFMGAGAAAVVASRWPVDDAVTERLMKSFYAGLAEGKTAAQALRAAQQSIRDDPTTHAPTYWAGLALIGDGGVHVPLRPRPRWLWPALAGAGIVIVALALVIGARRRRERAEMPQDNVV